MSTLAKKYDKLDLSGRDFRGDKSLVGASFRGSVLRQADFRGCDLRSADFRRADCSGALFDGAVFGRSRRRTLAVQLGGIAVSVLLSYAVVLLVALFKSSVPGNPNGLASIAASMSAIAALVAVARYGTAQRALTMALVAFAVAFAVAFVYLFIATVGGFGAMSYTFSFGHVAGDIGLGAFAFVAAIAGRGAVAVAVSATVAVSAAFAGAVAFAAAVAAAGTVRVAVAVAVAVASAFAAASAGKDAVADAVAGAGAGIVTVAGAILFGESFTGEFDVSFVAEGMVFSAFQLYVAWCVHRRDPRFALLQPSRTAVNAIGATRFEGAKLAGASFRKTRMVGVRLGDAGLMRTQWDGTSGLEDCLHDDPVLDQAAVRSLLASRVGREFSLVRANLHGTDLNGVDLRAANLKEANLTGALLTDADLTGACIEAWNLDNTTDLRGVKCDYVFLREVPDSKGSRQRRPADPERIFEPAEFEKLYTKALQEMEILLRKGLSPAAMREAFRELQEQHPGVHITKFEDRGSHVLAGLGLPPGADEASVERTLISSFEARFLVATAEKRLLLEHNQVLKEMALAATAAGVTVQVGDKLVEDKSIRVGGSLNVSGQVGSLSGDVRNLTQTQTLTQTGGDSAVLAAAIDKLVAAIAESKALAGPEKHEAAQQVATVVKAAESPKEPGWLAMAGKAMTRLTELLGKAPDLTKLLEAVGKAWEAVSRSIAT
jgi:uncharacterized protein YjbI with pentapeptide repeats